MQVYEVIVTDDVQILTGPVYICAESELAAAFIAGDDYEEYLHEKLLADPGYAAKLRVLCRPFDVMKTRL